MTLYERCSSTWTCKFLLKSTLICSNRRLLTIQRRLNEYLKPKIIGQSMKLYRIRSTKHRANTLTRCTISKQRARSKVLWKTESSRIDSWRSRWRISNILANLLLQFTSMTTARRWAKNYTGCRDRKKCRVWDRLKALQRPSAMRCAHLSLQ